MFGRMTFVSQYIGYLIILRLCSRFSVRTTAIHPLKSMRCGAGSSPAATISELTEPAAWPVRRHRTTRRILLHDPERWKPLFGKDHAQTRPSRISLGTVP